MDAYRTIVTKRDTRVFTEQAVPEETLRRILQAGRMAGSSKNSQTRSSVGRVSRIRFS